MVLLALLAEEPMHAYKMQQLIKGRRKDDVVNVARSNSVYQALDRLERDGYVQVRERVSGGSAPARNLYALTDAGREVLRRWMDSALSSPAREFPEFRAVLAVVSLVGPDLVADRLEERAAALDEVLAHAAQDADRAAGWGLPRVFMLESEHLEVVTRAEQDWLRRVVADLRSGALSWDPAQVIADRPRFEGA